jgi:trk system potassium uptake protein TrkA
VKAVVIGSGRVGATLARSLAEEGWDVSVVDEDEEALERLGSSWRQQFVLGHGMDTEVLERAGIADADAAVVATSGDNTNAVIAQVVKERYGVDRVVVRILDPARAEFYAAKGLDVVSPTRAAIHELRRRVVAAREEVA